MILLGLTLQGGVNGSPWQLLFQLGHLTLQGQLCLLALKRESALHLGSFEDWGNAETLGRLLFAEKLLVALEGALLKLELEGGLVGVEPEGHICALRRPVGPLTPVLSLLKLGHTSAYGLS